MFLFLLLFINYKAFSISRFCLNARVCLCELYLEHKLLPSEDSDGVVVSLADVWAVVGFFGFGRFCGSRRRRRSPGLSS